MRRETRWKPETQRLYLAPFFSTPLEPIECNIAKAGNLANSHSYLTRGQAVKRYLPPPQFSRYVVFYSGNALDARGSVGLMYLDRRKSAFSLTKIVSGYITACPQRRREHWKALTLVIGASFWAYPFSWYRLYVSAQYLR